MTRVLAVALYCLLCLLCCTAIALLRFGLPLCPEGSVVGWNTGAERVTVQDLSRRATTAVGSVADFQKAPVKVLAVYVARGSDLHD